MVNILLQRKDKTMQRIYLRQKDFVCVAHLISYFVLKMCDEIM